MNLWTIVLIVLLVAIFVVNQGRKKGK